MPGPIRLAAATFLTLGLLNAPVVAADHQVLMLNKGDSGIMVFEPALVLAQPGDTVTFVPTDKGHNAETMKGLIPEAAEAFKSKLNREFTVTLAVEGAYAIKCTPHLAMGMIMLVVVGDETADLGAIKEARMPKKAADRFADIFAKLGGD